MRNTQRRTHMYCPYCKKVQACEAVSTTACGKPSGQRRYHIGHEDLHWFRRGRRCKECHKKFLTAEVGEAFLDELVELRTALEQIKRQAERYIQESNAASETLIRLKKSLDVLKAPKLYQDAEDLYSPYLWEIELSSHVCLALESLGFVTVRDLCQPYSLELLKAKNFKETDLAEVTEYLTAHGLSSQQENSSHLTAPRG